MNYEAIKRTFVKLGYKVYNHRADIAFVTGMVGTAVGTGLFVKGAIKNQEVIQNYKDKKKQIEGASDLSEEDKKKLTKENVTEVITGSVKNLGAATAVSAAGYGLEIYSHVKLNSDLTKASAVANGLAASLAMIQQRVIADQGEDKWREYAYGDAIQQVAEVDPETGEVTESSTIQYGSSSIYDFSEMFNEQTAGKEVSGPWQSSKGSNKNFLCINLDCWNDRLHIYKKDIFLRDVWESIFGNLNGFRKEWANAGWTYEDYDGTTNSISYGLQSKDAATKMFWDEQTPDVRLVFNCYPDVYKVHEITGK